MKTYHLAQINIARMRAPLDSPVMAGFVAQLASLNALAEASRGFVWRLQTEGGDATALQAFEDPLILVNMSVWASVEDLRNYGSKPLTDPRHELTAQYFATPKEIRNVRSVTELAQRIGVTRKTVYAWMKDPDVLRSEWLSAD